MSYIVRPAVDRKGMPTANVSEIYTQADAPFPSLFGSDQEAEARLVDLMCELFG